MRTKLTTGQKLLVAATLFGMFFGAGNLIFPVHLGQLAGQNYIPASIGFIITAVTIPILGVAAIGNTHSDGLYSLACKIGQGYGYFFTCLLYLTIGPFFAIPRCATTSFTTGILPMLPEGSNEALPLLIFSFLFFVPVLFFSLRPGKITVWIGKIINPLFLGFLAVLVVAALCFPVGNAGTAVPAAGYETASSALFSAVIEGYGTMDAIAGLAFGIVVIDIVRRMGVTDDSAIAADVLRSGILTGVLMAVIYVLTILMGAQSRGLFALSENGGIAFGQIAEHYFGRAGSVILAFTITFACLKTSIGLVTSISEAFVRIFPKGPGYRGWAILFSVFSFVVSNVGLSAIIRWSLPVLMFIYPLAITLILLALTEKLFGGDRTVYLSVTICTLPAALFDFAKTLPEDILSRLHWTGLVAAGGNLLPLSALNLDWLLPAGIGLVIGLILHRIKVRR